MMIMMTKPYDDDDDTDDDYDHKNDRYIVAGAALGASVPCCLFLALWSRPFGPGPFGLGLGYCIAAGYSESMRGTINDPTKRLGYVMKLFDHARKCLEATRPC